MDRLMFSSQVHLIDRLIDWLITSRFLNFQVAYIANDTEDEDDNHSFLIHWKGYKSVSAQRTASITAWRLSHFSSKVE